MSQLASKKLPEKTVSVEYFYSTIEGEWRWRVWINDVGMLFSYEISARQYLWEALTHG